MASPNRLTFMVRSDLLTADEISVRLGLKPTSVQRARGSRLHIWELASPLAEEASPDDHLNGLLDVIEPKAAGVRKLLDAGAEVFWSCFVTAAPLGAIVELEPPLLSRLAGLGLPLVLDIYDSDPG
ncbi:DUF4279 domain-containing protein [Actinoplanes friuliensis]|uniref:DUF4279 domain-containing protein n=1 Tax=Actinoplanes friuliensis DSM 7358 TaxID=1246995 RepID=U5VX61_9ACTN|nr:DUF4279 domain-containing protein [Actinoplanes friuliensis]AGZ41382.1 hypothetical protein AFR_15500 [Actinoplanes friuliensis DSM 7358]